MRSFITLGPKPRIACFAMAALVWGSSATAAAQPTVPSPPVPATPAPALPPTAPLAAPPTHSGAAWGAEPAAPVWWQAPPPRYPREPALSPAVAGWAGALSTLVPLTAGLVVLGTAPEDDDEAGASYAVGLSLIGNGLVWGPAMGHYYVGDGGWATGLAFARVGLFGSSVASTFGGLFALFGNDEGAAGFFLALAGTTGAAGLGLATWDLVSAPDAARQKNAQRESLRVSLQPAGGRLTWRF